MAGERGWMPMSINLVPASTLGGHWDAVESGANKVGRTADRSLWRIAREVYVAETTKQARQEASQGTLARDFNDYWFKLLPWTQRLGQFKLDVDMPDSDVTIDYLMDNIWIVGSPDDAATQIRDMYHEVGGFGTLLAMGHEWEPKDQWVKSMTLLVNEVMPKLADLSIEAGVA